MSAALKLATKAKGVPVSPYRRSMIAKINVAKTQLRMEEADYRAALVEVTGHNSLTKCSDAQLARMLEWLASKGFRAVQGGGQAGSVRGGLASGATHPMARKARALWISLYHLNAVENPSEQALEAFAKRQLQCEKLVWANQRAAYKLIEALKAWAVREGWPEAGSNTRTQSPMLLQATLCGAILRKLKAAGIAQPGWDLLGASMQLCGRAIQADPGQKDASTADFQRLAEKLGTVLRTRSAGAEAPLSPPSERQ